MAENQITASRYESYMGERLLKPENKWLQINWDAFYKEFVSVNHMYLLYILNLLSLRAGDLELLPHPWCASLTKAELSSVRSFL